jgi:aspartate/methionine/tyrosine aminotransferase
MTAGCSGAMNIALCTVLNPTDKVLLIAPLLPRYIAWIRNYAAASTVIQTRPERNWEPDPADLEEALSDSAIRAVILNSPNHVTGALYSEQTIAGIAVALYRAMRSHAAQRPIWLLCDSSRVNLADNHPPLFDSYRYSIACYSVSHDHGLPGLRTGCAIVNPHLEHCGEVAKRLSRANDALGFYGPHRITQHFCSQLGTAQQPLPAVNRERLRTAHNRLCALLDVRPNPHGCDRAFEFVRDPPEAEELAREARARGLELVEWLSAGVFGCSRDLGAYARVVVRLADDE